MWVLVNRARTLTADVITAIGYTPANRAGDLFTGNVGIQAVAALFQVRDTSSPAGGVGGSVELCASNNSGT